MTERDSHKLALEVVQSVPKYEIKLGPSTAESYVHDPRHLGFVAARYKFVAKMLDGAEDALEVGCGDAFGAPIVAQAVRHLLCTDINARLVDDDKLRCAVFQNISFSHADFRKNAMPDRFDGIFMLDVLEHIYPEEEAAMLGNVVASLRPHGVMVVGIPNITAEQFASEMSRHGHVNLKNHMDFRATMRRYFHNVFLFSMNDEVIHNGYYPMAHYLFALCCGRLAR
jgi:protein-L-isoaspartate O-methyltransferase